MAPAFLRWLTVSILILAMWVPTSALAEEDDVGPTSFELVDQALQVLRQNPQDLARVMEFIRAALEIETLRPTGTIRNLELQSAIVAIRRGDVDEVERRLVATLAPDPHAKHHDPLASAPPEPESDLSPTAPLESEPGTTSIGAATVGRPDQDASGAGWAQVLGYGVVVVGTVVLGGAAAIETRRSRV